MREFINYCLRYSPIYIKKLIFKDGSENSEVRNGIYKYSSI